MDKRILAVLVFITALFAVAFAGCTGTENGSDQPVDVIVEEKIVSVVVGIDGEYPPYSFIDSDGNAQGFDVDSVKWIADKKGFEVEIKPMAWDSIIPSLIAGKIDMVYSGMTITPDRLEKVNFSKPYWIANQGVAVKKGSEIRLDDIKSGKAVIGTQAGCTAAEWISEYLVDTGIMPEENLKQSYSSIALAITDLENGRVDAVMYDTPVIIESIKGKDLEKLGTIETNEEYGVAIRKTDVLLLETMNEGIDELMADPYWQELIDKYDLA